MSKTVGIHALVFSTTLMATAAVGFAAAALYDGFSGPASPKGDKLVIADACTIAFGDNRPCAAPMTHTVTVEKRGEGISVVTRLPRAL